MPQRTAHHLVGEIVGKARRAQVPLAELPLAAFQESHPDLDARVFDVLGVEKAVAAFVSYGSTAPQEVARQIAEWKKRLADDAT